MTGNVFGDIFKCCSFGESHGPAVGAVIDGCPAGADFSLEFLRKELSRRRPGQSAWSSSRSEPDEPEVLSGVFQGKTLGSPIAVIVRNKDARPEDYEKIKSAPRPGHADDLWKEKFGEHDHRGGGRSSGRETVARVIAGAVARMVLKTLCPDFHAMAFVRCIAAGSSSGGPAGGASSSNDFASSDPKDNSLSSGGGKAGAAADSESAGGDGSSAAFASDGLKDNGLSGEGAKSGKSPTNCNLRDSDFKTAGLYIEEGELQEAEALFQSRSSVDAFPVRFPHKEKSQEAERLLNEAKVRGESLGALAEVWTGGLPVGLGQPVFRKFKSDLASALLGIGATSGFSIGRGFKAAFAAGSKFHSQAKHYGGLRGGLSTGERLRIQIPFKPPSSFGETALKGRHDPCIAPRAVPVVEAMIALTVLNHLLWKRLDRL